MRAHRPHHRSLAARVGIQSRSPAQPHEREEVPSTRLSGRGPRPPAQARAASRARTGRTRGGPTHLAGRSEEHQHAGLPRGGPLRPVWKCRLGRYRPRDAVQPMRNRSPRVCSMRVLRSRKSVRVHAADSRPHHAEKHTEQLHILLATDYGRASDDHAPDGQRAKGLRRSVQVLVER